MSVCVCTSAHLHSTDFTILSSCAHRIQLNFVLELSALLLNWSVAHFPLSLYSPVCLKHTANQHFEKPTHSLSTSPPLPPLPPPPPPPPPMSMSAEANCQGLWDTLSTPNVGHSKQFITACVCSQQVTL
ncbi:hypothetical protein AMECASPLE_009573 [Ameca splendens]|uniref:Uncharacterized protein n=1 Tax=Ameca splendens TaxID=208324 RepID=A0ABV1A7E4_9TELE